MPAHDPDQVILRLKFIKHINPLEYLSAVSYEMLPDAQFVFELENSITAIGDFRPGVYVVLFCVLTITAQLGITISGRKNRNHRQLVYGSAERADGKRRDP